MYAAKTLKEEVEKTKKEKEALDARREEQKSNLYFRQGPRSRAVNRLKNMLKACYPGEDAEKKTTYAKNNDAAPVVAAPARAHVRARIAHADLPPPAQVRTAQAKENALMVEVDVDNTRWQHSLPKPAQRELFQDQPARHLSPPASPQRKKVPTWTCTEHTAPCTSILSAVRRDVAASKAVVAEETPLKQLAGNAGTGTTPPRRRRPAPADFDAQAMACAQHPPTPTPRNPAVVTTAFTSPAPAQAVRGGGSVSPASTAYEGQPPAVCRMNVMLVTGRRESSINPLLLRGFY